MYDILSLFSVLYPHLSSVRQFSQVVDDGSGQYAKYLTLVRRWELPDGPTLFQHRYSLGDCLLFFQHVISWIKVPNACGLQQRCPG